VAITYATITGRITQPGTDVGIRAKVTATPLTTGNMLKFSADNRLTVGPQTAETDNGGILAALKVPLNSDTPGVLWKITAEPIDKVPGVPARWTLGVFDITASSDLADLVEIAAVSVPASANLNDLAMETVLNNPSSGTSTTLARSFAAHGTDVNAYEATLPSGTEYVYMLTDGSGTLLDILSGKKA